MRRKFLFQRDSSISCLEEVDLYLQLIKIHYTTLFRRELTFRLTLSRAIANSSAALEGNKMQRLPLHADVSESDTPCSDAIFSVTT